MAERLLSSKTGMLLSAIRVGQMRMHCNDSRLRSRSYAMEQVRTPTVWLRAGLLLLLAQARFGQINVALNSAEDIVIDHLLVAQLKDGLAFHLE